MPENKVSVTQTVNEVVIKTPGPQGPSGRTILNGNGAPASNLGRAGDFYYNTASTDFYGPKLSDTTWSGAAIIKLSYEQTGVAFVYSWELSQVQGVDDKRYVEFEHNLGFYPNVTVKTSAGDILETGIDYVNINTIRLTMAQPFAGTAYLS